MPVDPQRQIKSFLQIDDQHLKENAVGRPLDRLCLAGCEVTDSGLATLSPSPRIQWLDLSRLPVTNNSILRLAPKADSLTQLSVEATRIDVGLSAWLARATNLQEVDVSWTPMNDEVVNVLGNAKQIETLWMTGTQVSDASIDKIVAMKALQAVDLQRTKVTDAGIAKLRRARPDLSINPLELRSEQ